MMASTSRVGNNDCHQALIYHPESHVLASSSVTISPPESFTDTDCKDNEDVGVLSDVQSEADVLLRTPQQATFSCAPPVETLEDVKPTMIKITLQGDSYVTKVNRDYYEKNSSNEVLPYTAVQHMCDIFQNGLSNISLDTHLASLLLIVGAQGIQHCRSIHKYVLASHSPLMRKYLEEFPECSTIMLPNYTDRIIEKVITLLYTGEAMAVEEKDISVIKDAMEELGIYFDLKKVIGFEIAESFFKHEDIVQVDNQVGVGVTDCVPQHQYQQTSENVEMGDEAVITQGEAVVSISREARSESGNLLVDASEVDQIGRNVALLERVNKDKPSKAIKMTHSDPYFRSVKVVSVPDPNNPNRIIKYVRKLRDPRQVYLGKNMDPKNEEAEKMENEEAIKRILSKRSYSDIVDLANDEEEAVSYEKKACLETDGQKREQCSAPLGEISGNVNINSVLPSILGDEQFRELLASGRIRLNETEAVSGGDHVPLLQTLPGASTTCMVSQISSSGQLSFPPPDPSTSSTHMLTAVSPSTQMNEQLFIQIPSSSASPSLNVESNIFIPPCRPEGTGITLVNTKSPILETKETLQDGGSNSMPKLQAVEPLQDIQQKDNCYEVGSPSKAPSIDNEIPRLSKMVIQPPPVLHLMNPRDLKTPLVVRASSLGFQVHNQQGSCRYAVLVAEPAGSLQSSTSTFSSVPAAVIPEQKVNRFLNKSMINEHPSVSTALKRAVGETVNVEQQKRTSTRAEVVVGSRKKPIPAGMNVDIYDDQDSDTSDDEEENKEREIGLNRSAGEVAESYNKILRENPGVVGKGRGRERSKGGRGRGRGHLSKRIVNRRGDGESNGEILSQTQYGGRGRRGRSGGRRLAN